MRKANIVFFSFCIILLSAKNYAVLNRTVWASTGALLGLYLAATEELTKLRGMGLGGLSAIGLYTTGE